MLHRNSFKGVAGGDSDIPDKRIGELKNGGTVYYTTFNLAACFTLI